MEIDCQNGAQHLLSAPSNSTESNYPNYATHTLSRQHWDWI